MTTKIGYGLGLFVIGGLLVFFYVTRPVQSLHKSDAEYSLEASELFKAFDLNEADANTKYLNKVIEVTGTIREVQDRQVLLETEATFGIICEFDEHHHIEHLQPGQMVTCKGQCTGKLMDVVLSRSVIINKDQ